MSLLKSTTDENASAGFETTFAVLTDIHARALTALVQCVTQLWFSCRHSIQLFAFRLFFSVCSVKLRCLVNHGLQNCQYVSC